MGLSANRRMSVIRSRRRIVEKEGPRRPQRAIHGTKGQSSETASERHGDRKRRTGQACLRRLLLQARRGGASDGQLLECSSARGRRRLRRLGAATRAYGAGVCRRVLRDWPTPRTPLPATFLCWCAGRRPSRPRDAVAPGYSGCYRTALEGAGRGRPPPLKNARPERRSEPNLAGAAETCGLLDEELTRLPRQVSAAVVLCDLEGRAGARPPRVCAGRGRCQPAGAARRLSPPTVPARRPPAIPPTTLPHRGARAGGAACPPIITFSRDAVAAGNRRPRCSRRAVALPKE